MSDNGKSGFGTFKPYRSMDIDQYLKRFTCYLFTKNVVEPPASASESDKLKYSNQRKNWLLAEIGQDAYSVLDGLCGDASPEDKSAEQLEALLKTHFKPKKNKYTERDRFSSRKQMPNEDVAQYSSALCQLAKSCEFGSHLDQALQTQFIINLRSLKVKEKVSEGAPSFQELVALAATYERMYVSETSNSVLVVNQKAHQKNTQKKQPSTNEKKEDNKPQKKNKLAKTRCFNCNKYGHYANNCPAPKKKKDKSTVHVVNKQDDSLELYPVMTNSSGRVPMNLKLNGIPFVMELDTAAKASVIDKFQYKKFFADCPLRKTTTLVWGEPLPMLGEFDVEVNYNNQCKTLVLPVVDKPFPSLYGLPWIRAIRPDFDKLFPKTVHPVLQDSSLQAELSQKYPTVFGGGTEPIKGFEVSLVMHEGAQPVFRGPRTLAIPLRAPTEKALQEMEAAGHIEQCEPGPWGTPIVPIRKSDGRVRVCGDFSVTLNPHLVVSGRALPLIDDLTTVNEKFFCLLDMKLAYLQLPLSPASSEMCKLNTPFGTFKCLRMPFGIASAPTAFQEVICTILAGIENVFKYLDDVLLWGNTEAECLETLHEVLSRFEKYRVKLNLSKCSFLQKSVVYLGFQLDENGSRPDPARMDELLKKPRPTNQTQLKSFLGMITFFHKYGKNLATILKPLYELRKHAVSFYWGPPEQQAYEKALNLLASTVLVPYSLERPLRLTTDASPVGAGAILSHVNVDGSEDPIAFASKMFTDRELKYPVHEREGAALIFGIKKFDKYLTGRSFEIVSDNKPLVAIFGDKSHQKPLSAARLQRWQMLLTAHQYTIVHKKSEEIPHADFLSRFPSQDTTPVEAELYWVNHLPTELISAEEIADYTKKDPLLRQVLNYVLNGWPESPSEELKVYYSKYLELSAESNCLLWDGRVVVPLALQSKVLNLLHEAHPGGCRMKSLARSYVWWPNIDQQLEDLVKSCGVCQALMASVPHDSYVPWTWPTRRWQRLHMDFGNFQGQELLVLIDAHSKWPEVRIMHNTKCETVIDALRSLFAAYGLPEEVVSDNGQPFASAEMASFLKANGVVQTFSPTYHPQSNGAAENEVKTVKRSLLKQLLDKKTENRSLQHKIDVFLFTYRNTPHSVTKVSPAELFLGRRPRTPLSILQPSNILKMKMKQQQEKKKEQEVAKISHFKAGDLVWARSFTSGKIKWQAGIIESCTSSVSYIVQVKTRVRQISSSHLRPRSPQAQCIEEDPAAQSWNSEVVIPTMPIPQPEQPEPGPVVPGPESVVKMPSGLSGPQVSTHISSPEGPSPVVSPPEVNVSPSGLIPPGGTPKRPPAVVKPRASPPPDPAPVKFSRSGRPIILPKRLLD